MSRPKPGFEETVHTTKYWPRTDRTTIDGLRVTSATRTVIDLALARAPKVRLQAAIESAVRTGASAPLVVERRLSELRGPGRWGCRLLDATSCRTWAFACSSTPGRTSRAGPRT